MLQPNRFLLALLLASPLAISAAVATATTLLAESLAELTADSERVVIGRVDAVTPQLHGGKVERMVTLSVSEVIRGTVLTGPVHFRLEGGRLPRLETRVAGSPTVRVGEELLVFLERTGDGVLTPAGLSLGLFHLHPTPAGLVAERELGDVRLLQTDGHGQFTPAAQSIQTVFALPDLRAAIGGVR